MRTLPRFMVIAIGLGGWLLVTDAAQANAADAAKIVQRAITNITNLTVACHQQIFAFDY